MESLIPDFASLNPLHEDVNRVAERMQDLEIRVEKLEGSTVSAD